MPPEKIGRVFGAAMFQCGDCEMCFESSEGLARHSAYWHRKAKKEEENADR